MATPQIHTYHCLCTTLLLATTHSLSALPRRAPPSLDSAIIVPLPAAPQPPSRPSSSSLPPRGDSDSDSEDAAKADAPGTSTERVEHAGLPSLGYTLLLSTTLDRRPTLIRRSDGFERRYLVRCGRCRLAVGYELDAEHYMGSVEIPGAMDVDGDHNEASGKEKERTKVVYLLPGGIMSTEIMASGRKIGEKEVMLGQGTAAVAAYE